MNKSLAVFGCSWSFGMPYLGTSIPVIKEGKEFHMYDCWPMRFAEKNPNYTVYNFAKGGTGIGYHIALLHKFLKSEFYNKKTTTIVFQVTSPYRYTYNIKECTDNLYDWSTKDNYNLIYAQNPRTLKVQDRPRWNFLTDTYDPQQVALYKRYIKSYPEELVHIEFESQISHVKNIADFVYSHKYYKGLSVPKPFSECESIPSVRKILGEKRFNRFVEDDGDHFGKQGLDYLARWIGHQIHA